LYVLRKEKWFITYCFGLTGGKAEDFNAVKGGKLNIFLDPVDSYNMKHHPVSYPTLLPTVGSFVAILASYITIQLNIRAPCNSLLCCKISATLKRCCRTVEMM